MSAASVEIELHSVCCDMEEGYRRRPALLIAEVCQGLQLPTAGSPDLSALPGTETLKAMVCAHALF